MVVRPLRPALRYPAHVYVDRVGRLPGNGAPAVPTELRDWGIMGGFVLVWWLLIAAWYVPLTVYRFITFLEREHITE